MANIQIDALQPGKVVAEDVATPDGRVLLAKGGKVEPWHIPLFRGLGIAMVDVADSQEDARMRMAAEYVLEFFAFVNPNSPAMENLYRFIVELVAHRLAGGFILPGLEERRAQNVEQLADVFPMEIVGPERIVTHETQLASFPDVYFKIRQEMDSPTASVNRLSQLVSQDLGLTAKLLKLSNSPLYAFGEPVESIRRAIAVIGMEELSTLALGISAVNYFQGIPPELIDMMSFWRHSISCGIFAKILASNLGEANTERYFIAGLLHDAGRLILFKKMPYASAEALLYARENSVPIVEAEQVVFGFTHTTVSRELLSQWKFPQPLSDLINHHHDPESSPTPKQAAIIHVADVMANAMAIATGALYVLPPFEERAWEALGIPADAIGNICGAYEVQAEETIKAFA